MDSKASWNLSDYHRECLASFRHLITTPNSLTPTVRQDQELLHDFQEDFDRYKVWAANVGAGNSGEHWQLSLDFRLQDAAFLKSQVARLIDTLSRTVKKAQTLLDGTKKPFEEAEPFLQFPGAADPDQSETSEDDSPWDISDDSSGSGCEGEPGIVSSKQSLDIRDDSIEAAPTEMGQVLKSIKLIIECLYKLPLRKPAPIDRVKASRGRDMSLYQHFDVLYVRDKFPLADDFLVHRLGNLISRRRQLLEYRVTHTERLRPPVQHYTEAGVQHPGIPEGSKSGSAPSIAPQNAKSTVLDTTSRDQSWNHLTKATVQPAHAVITSLGGLYPPSVTESRMSSASEYTESQKLKFPPRPLNEDGQPLIQFECPYCGLAEHIPIEPSRAWESHVLRDLQPYVCTFPDCDMFDHMFESRQQWFNHELDLHRARWSCNTCPSPYNDDRTYLSFGTEENFLMHMTSVHQLAEAKLNRSMDVFRQPSSMVEGDCCLCKKHSQKLKSHLGRHMEQMALFALPRPSFEDPGCSSNALAYRSHSSSRHLSSDSGQGHFITSDKYAVGWVCALPLEMAAAEGMLDKVHPPPTAQDPDDHNTYLLGEVCGHNVAIACLPASFYGITPAATVAKQMLRSFRSIRFGLMVGIGGGIPSKDHDIRLGDIVVGKPTDTNGGVIQYDLGKNLQRQDFERTGMLHAPPQILLAALAPLEADHITQASRVTEFLASLPEEMKKRFSHPGVSNDHLYLAEYPHIKDAQTCEECDDTQRVKREDRDGVGPVVHYGTIASGNQITKDATVRDQLGQELGAICFDMEAAGLRDFPSLVIRGICDYADSHKNKMWQPYAAATAAAYAKELLSVIPPLQVLQKNPKSQAVSIASGDIDVSQHSNELLSEPLVDHERTSHTSADRVTDLVIVQEARYDSDDVRSSPRCEKSTRVRIQQTIKDWADAADGEPFLWITGPSGAGKSTLVRSVADSFHQDKRLGAGYFFKSGEQGRNGTNRLFSTLAMQLAETIPSFHISLRASLEDIDKDLINEKDLRFQFEKLIKDPLENLPPMESDTAQRIIILDALDECERPENLQRILGFLLEICNVSTMPSGLRVVFTSRPDPIVVHTFEPFIHDGLARELPLHSIFLEDTKEDIRLYLETNLMRIKTQARIQQNPWPTVAEINYLVELCTYPEPLFIYAATLLRFVHDEKSLQSPKKQLKIWIKQCENNKSQLHQMYNLILEQIFVLGKDTDFNRQLEFLGALALTTLPLSLASLTSLFDLGTSEVTWWLPILHPVLDIPSDPHLPLRLLHKSFADFLFRNVNPDDSPLHLNASETHAVLATQCIHFMSRRLRQDLCGLHKLNASSDEVDSRTLSRCIPPELRYSCLYWVYHLQASRRRLENGDGIYDFLLQHLLHWFEALSLLKLVSVGLKALQDLAVLVKDSRNSTPKLVSFVEDATKALFSFGPIIEGAPLQTYGLLLLSSSVTSQVRQQFWHEHLSS